MNKILKTIKENLENLQSKNLVYREIRREDVFPFFDANQNDLFVNYLSWNKRTELSEFKGFFLDKYNKSRENEEIWITVSQKNTLSWVAFIKIAPYEDVVTGSIYMHPTFWKTGYGAEAIRACAKVYFEESKKDHFYVLIDKNNEISIKLNIGLGAKITGEDFMLHENGKRIDLVKLKIEKNAIKLPDLTSII